jgi:hypothetical protein
MGNNIKSRGLCYPQTQIYFRPRGEQTKELKLQLMKASERNDVVDK